MKRGEFSKKDGLWNTFFVNDSDEKPMCLICNIIFSATKEYNVKRYYKTNHFRSSNGKLYGDDRKQKVNQLQIQLNSQCFMFQNMRSDNKKIPKFLTAHRIAKKMTAYSDGDFVKKCPINVAQEIYPKMMSEIQEINLSRWTVAKRIDVLTDDICVTLKDKVKNFVSWSFAADESTDTEQLAIFVKGVGRESNETKELLSLLSIKSTTTGADIFTEVLMLLKLSEWT